MTSTQLGPYQSVSYPSATTTTTTTTTPTPTLTATATATATATTASTSVVLIWIFLDDSPPFSSNGQSPQGKLFIHGLDGDFRNHIR